MAWYGNDRQRVVASLKSACTLKREACGIDNMQVVKIYDFVSTVNSVFLRRMAMLTGCPVSDSPLTSRIPSLSHVVRTNLSKCGI
jgi:hypothetical protein